MAQIHCWSLDEVPRVNTASGYMHVAERREVPPRSPGRTGDARSRRGWVRAPSARGTRSVPAKVPITQPPPPAPGSSGAGNEPFYKAESAKRRVLHPGLLSPLGKSCSILCVVRVPTGLLAGHQVRLSSKRRASRHQEIKSLLSPGQCFQPAQPAREEGRY